MSKLVICIINVVGILRIVRIKIFFNFNYWIILFLFVCLIEEK